MPATTPMGIAIRPCKSCGHTHPVTRRHCGQCGRATAFLNEAGSCLTCATEA